MSMPVFNTEEEFNEYFKKEKEVVNKYRDKEGNIVVSGEEQLDTMMKELGFKPLGNYTYTL